MKENKGFTLMEVMIVIAIIAIITAIAIPNIFAYLPKHRLNQGAREVYSALQYARLRAVKEATNVVATFDTGADSYTVFLDDGSGGGTAGDNIQNGSEPTLRSGAMPKDVDITTASFSSGTWVRFDFRGMPNGLGGNVKLFSTSQNQLARMITVIVSGSTRMSFSTNGGSSWEEL
jgi:type IV fimbrial biogenesis protein FimT